MKTIESAYAKVAPGYPFEYSFLDQKFDQLYRTDLRQQTIIMIFSGLAIFIACLGLFGLASFTAAKRIKGNRSKKSIGLIDSWYCFVTFQRPLETSTSRNNYCNSRGILCNEFMA